MLNCPLCRAGLIALAAFSINPVHASVITDATNDFLPSFTVAPHNSDLDVVSAAGFYNTSAQQFTFSATLAGALGQTPGALYVWGLDRGQGTQRFLNGSPPIGAGVFFDSVLILRPNGTGVYNDFINNTMTNLAAGSVQLNGNTITGADLPLSLFPSTGFQPGEYTWNIWPRVGLGQNNQISDFAPDAANVPVTSVPEPETYVMLLSGLGWHAGYCNECESCKTGGHNLYLCGTARAIVVGHHGGITVFNSLVQFDIKPTDKVAVIGMAESIIN